MKRLQAFLALPGLALLIAACGGLGTGTTGVATLPSPSSALEPRSSSPHSPAPSDLIAQGVAYARCMRTNGVPGWPDPDSDGTFDKTRIRPAVGELGSPHYQTYLTAASACQDQLPANMREPTHDQIQQAWTDDRNFAQCMRDHGLANAPDPIADDHGRPYFGISGTGIDPSSPRIQAMAQACESQLHLSTLPPVSGGGG
jgi:hypothetical protein